MCQWNNLWKLQTKGAWTRTLIPEIIPWVTRKYGSLDFHLTQALTGHGCFNSYLYKFRRKSSPQCRYCEMEDTAEHTLFVCGRWDQLRLGTEAGLMEVLTVETLVSIMLRSSQGWDEIARFVKKVMTNKEEDERRQQRREAGAHDQTSGLLQIRSRTL